MADILGVEIGCVESRLATDKYRTFHQVLQFADISRIRQAAQKLHGIGGKFRARQSVRLCLTVSEVTHQQRDVLTAFAQSG